MSDSKQAAEVSALRALGWTISATPDGAVVIGVVAPVAGAHRRASRSPTGSSGSTGPR